MPTKADLLPQFSDKRPIAVVWMVGVAGSDFWPHFKASSFFQDGLDDPLDRWSAHIGHALAEHFGGRALFPFDGPPYYPFQQWADRSEPTQSSLMMLRMHPQYGLWHAYRFALALPDLVPENAAELVASKTGPVLNTCADCDEKPCLSACPVHAYTGSAFRLTACADRLQADPGGD